MAIEDGLCLAELIHAEADDFATAFRRFEAARVVRTARVQLESRALREFYHAEGIAWDVRDQTTAAWDEEHMYDCLAWLYDSFPLPTEGEQQQSGLIRSLDPTCRRAGSTAAQED
jgi:salicylate hydroxylase